MEDSNLYFTALAGEDLHLGAPTIGSLSIPLGVARNIAIGKHKMYIVAVVTAALTTAGKTLDIDLLTALDAAITNTVVHIQDKILQVSALAPIGARFQAEIPEQALNSSAFLQESLFLGIETNATNGAPATGNLIVFLTTEPGVQHTYPTTNIV